MVVEGMSRRGWAVTSAAAGGLRACRLRDSLTCTAQSDSEPDVDLKMQSTLL